MPYQYCDVCLYIGDLQLHLKTILLVQKTCVLVNYLMKLHLDSNEISQILGIAQICQSLSLPDKLGIDSNINESVGGYGFTSIIFPSSDLHGR